MRAGTVWVNCFEEGGLSVPFGGMKQSGNGRDKSVHAIDKYVDAQDDLDRAVSGGRSPATTALLVGAGRRDRRGDGARRRSWCRWCSPATVPSSDRSIRPRSGSSRWRRSMLLVVVVLLVAAAAGLWRGRPWAATIVGHRPGPAAVGAAGRAVLRRLAAGARPGRLRRPARACCCSSAAARETAGRPWPKGHGSRRAPSGVDWACRCTGRRHMSSVDATRDGSRHAVHCRPCRTRVSTAARSSSPSRS